MRIRVQNELLLLNIITVLLIIVITLQPSSALRIVLGLPFVLFFPGYTLMAALFHRKSQLDSLERVAVSFGLSIVVVPIIGLILNYTPWGIRLYPILIFITIFIFTTSLIAWQRRRRLPEMERFTIFSTLSLDLGRGQGFPDKILSIVLIVVILAAIGTLGYIIISPRAFEGFTEFYILGSEGKAEGYPRELVVGEEAKVMVGIINREHEIVSYRIEVRIDGEGNNELGPLVLGHDEEWEELVSFTPDKPGENQKLELLLYKNEENEPYLEPLRLWVKVTEPR